MTQTDHLQLIRARCVELLEIYSKPKPDAFHCCPKCHRPMNEGNSPNSSECTETDDEEGVCEAYAKLASCAGAAEAGWLATVAAVDAALASIDDLQGEMPYNIKMCEKLISAWPIELLNNK